MTKSELRKLYLKRRSLLSNSEISSISRRIAERFFANIDLRSVSVLHVYIPIIKFKEIDTAGIYERVWCESPHIQTAAPRSDLITGEIEHLEFNSETVMIENQWGIREPQNGVSVNERSIDLVIVPLLCFDQRGYRVGYGKGFYDKFLAKCRPDCMKVGLSIFPPEQVAEDVDEYDIRLDLAITPERSVRFDP